MADDIVQFVRQRDLIFRRELGQGACGRTVLLYDDVIDEHFVCKKYTPYDELLRHQLFENFKREIKILHRLQHRPESGTRTIPHRDQVVARQQCRRPQRLRRK